MNKAPLHKHVKFVAKKSAKKMGVLQAARSISREKYTEKVSASLLYGLLSSIAVNFFFQPGHVYSSGATGLAQVLSALSVRTLGFEIPVSLTFYAINIPLLILAWYKIGHKFTIFTCKKHNKTVKTDSQTTMWWETIVHSFKKESKLLIG